MFRLNMIILLILFFYLSVFVTFIFTEMPGDAMLALFLGITPIAFSTFLSWLEV